MRVSAFASSDDASARMAAPESSTLSRSIAVCSSGLSGRSSTVSARAPIRLRRLAASCVDHSASETDAARWPSFSGLSRLRTPWPRMMALPPIASPPGGVLALRIAGHVNTAAEGERAGVERLRQRGLTGADYAGEHDVWSGDQSALVEHPRVVDEGAARVEVLPDEDAGRAESGLGEKRVAARQCCCGVLMLGEFQESGRA